ncbi:MAG: hypothetical protein Q4D66_02010 [Bacteroidales bacterium]|nr:hypothetical protein [Bacteroidales bacterium]
MIPDLEVLATLLVLAIPVILFVLFCLKMSDPRDPRISKGRTYHPGSPGRRSHYTEP